MIDPVALKYPGPRCIISENKDKLLNIRIEWINSFKADKNLKIPLDDIFIKDYDANNNS